MNELVKPIPENLPRGWEIQTQNGQNGQPEIISPNELVANQTKMGTEIRYGERPEGYDGFVIKEPNGGGAVTIPYLFVNGELYVGAQQQKRVTTGGLVTEVPRGFSLPHEEHDQTAKREFEEETGVTASLADRIKPLPGKPINPNTAYFQANLHKGEGVKLFGIEFKADEVQLRRDSKDPERRVYTFTPDIQGDIKEKNEKIKPEGIRFFHADMLKNTPDAFTLAALARLPKQTTLTKKVSRSLKPPLV